jgi:hypothetical protein
VQRGPCVILVVELTRCRPCDCLRLGSGRDCIRRYFASQRDFRRSNASSSLLLHCHSSWNRLGRSKGQSRPSSLLLPNHLNSLSFQFAWHHRPNSLRRIQANIESLLHISPSSPTPGEALTAATASAPKGWLSRLSDRAHSGADPKNDEQMDHTGDEAQSKVRDGKARARVAV